MRKDGKKVIVSLTSYPARINLIKRTIDSLMDQTLRPDVILLCLSREEFKDNNVVTFLSEDKYQNLILHWEQDNIRSYKKFFYAFQYYADDIIITVDDDTIYDKRMVESLVEAYDQNHNCVIARRVHCMTFEKNGSVTPYNEWIHECQLYIGIPRMDLVGTGVGGILYPPGIFDSEVFRKDIFIKECPYADDLWLKTMELRKGIPTVLVEGQLLDIYIEEIAYNGLSFNKNSNGGNDIQFRRLIERYGKKSLFNWNEDEKIFKEDVYKIKREIVWKKLCEKINAEKHILIYGAGKIAGIIINLLSDAEIQHIDAFIVNDISINPKEIKGIKVNYYKNYLYTKEKILVALWHTKQKELVEGLVREGFDADRFITLDEQMINVLLTKEKISKNNVKRYEKWNGSADYWERRYIFGNNSGSGSYGRLALFKAEILNKFVEDKQISSVIEWGCGDGNQLSLMKYPSYVGLDVSKRAIKMCQEKFLNDSSKTFVWSGEKGFEITSKAEMTISLDVLYHLIEDEVFEKYMFDLFFSSKKYVCIYSCDFDKEHAQHVKCRKFTNFIKDNFAMWKLLKKVDQRYPMDENDPENTSWSDFYFYEYIGL